MLSLHAFAEHVRQDVDEAVYLALGNNERWYEPQDAVHGAVNEEAAIEAVRHYGLAIDSELQALQQPQAPRIFDVGKPVFEVKQALGQILTDRTTLRKHSSFQQDPHDGECGAARKGISTES